MLVHEGCCPFWEIQNGQFLRPQFLDAIRSEKGRILADAVAQIDNGLKVFLRGSLLECPNPFADADADLFVVYKDSGQLEVLREVLPNSYHYDIKQIGEGAEGSDFVYHALLRCRSLQLCGEPLFDATVYADKDFAWRHWVKYCPALIPSIIDSSKSWSLIHFKLLVRCFGVLSLLRDRRFTRDIGGCIHFAETENPEMGQKLRQMRTSIENHSADIFALGEIKIHLANRFDELFPTWD
jgi:hypothetical protein